MDTNTTIHTRAEYMHGEVSHDDYYAQFVTDGTKRHVRSWFTPEGLRTALSKDKHLNSIPLSDWDRVAIRELDQQRVPLASTGRFISAIPYNGEAIKAAGDIVTRAVLVCIAKRAARMIAAEED